jgi:hypothetical protein
MAGRNVLAVLLEDGLQSRLRQAIWQRGDGTPTVRAVAPARVGPLESFATDEDDADVSEAAERALGRAAEIAERFAAPRGRRRRRSVDEDSGSRAGC